ncbi:MAG: hypothetical protein J5732_06015 [Bacteroidaceae bacterium]|nr:hypothetical protein [Bacteroidaceae bacterium]
MKKVLYILAILAAGMTSCTRFEDPVSKDFGTGPVISVAASAVADSSATFTLTVDTLNTRYYSVAFMEGDPVPVDSMQLLKMTAGGVDVTGLKGGAAMWNAKLENWPTNTKTLNLSGLLPNTTYTMYAVASSEEGILGNVALATIKTSDNVSPFVEKVSKSTDQNSISASFSEAVSRGEGAVRASYLKPYGDLSVKNPIDDENVTVTIEGNVVSVSVANVPAGAIVLVDMEAGAFIDATGHASNAIVTDVDLLSGEFSSDFWWMADKKTIKFNNGMIEGFGGAFVDWKSFKASIKYSEPLFLNEDKEIEGVFVIYSGDGYLTRVDVSGVVVLDSCIEFSLPKEMEYGCKVGFVIPANVVCDVFGNPNEAFEVPVAWQRSYGLTRQDIVGKWDWTYLSGASGEDVTETIIISPDLDSDNGVVISNLFSAGSAIHAEFDGDMALLTIPDFQYLAPYYDVYDIYYVTADGSDATVLQYNPSSKTFVSLGEKYEFGYYAMKGNENAGWLNYTLSPITVTFSEDQSYGLTRDILVGDYLWCYTKSTEVPDTLAFTIEADPDEENGLVFKDFLLPGSVMYASFNTATSQLVIPDWQILGQASGYLAINSTWDLEDILFEVNPDGTAIAYGSRSEDNCLWCVFACDAEQTPKAYFIKSMGDIVLKKDVVDYKAVSRTASVSEELRLFTVDGPMKSAPKPMFIENVADGVVRR